MLDLGSARPQGMSVRDRCAGNFVGNEFRGFGFGLGILEVEGYCVNKGLVRGNQEVPSHKAGFATLDD